jgi:ABC-2 type transport system permease protein
VILAVARHEFVRQARDQRFRVLAFVLLVLLVAATATGWLDASNREGQREAASHTVHETWLAQGEKNAHSATHFGTFAFLPLSRLAFLDPGATPFGGVATFVESHRRGARSRGEGGGDPLGSPTGLAQVLLPLLIVLVGFDTLAGERERGTLAHLVGLGASVRSVVLGKALGLAAVVGAALAPAVLVATALLLLPPGADTWRSLVFAGGQTLHLVTWCLVVTALSALARESRTALTLGLVLWSATALVLPRLASDLAAVRVPLPSARAHDAAIAAELEDQGSAHDPTSATYAALRDEALREHGVERVEDLPFNFNGWVLQRGEEREAAVFARLDGELAARHARQEALVDTFAWTSPRLALARLSAAAAGSDRRHVAHFDAAVESYRAHLVKTLNDVLTYDPAARDPKHVVGREVWERVGRLEYTPPGVGFALAGVRTSALQLLAFALASALFLWFAARRLSARPTGERR